MKTLVLTVAALALFAAEAPAKTYQYTFEKEMPLEGCKQEMQRVASEWQLTLQQWQENDYYLLDQGEYAGNAYYAQATCYIYIH